uniref:EGF-like domain-containing protein n=1 Tax=Caenorhabditis japonica TaxID=281687 RepID=A0A8R1EID2_CAEJA
MKKLIGRCECSDKTICEPEEFRKQHDDVIEENLERTSCDEMDCGKNGECVMGEEGVPICRCREGNSAFESLSECGKVMEVFSMPSGGHFDISVRNESLLKCDAGCEGVQQLEMDFRTLVLKSKLFEVQFEKQRANIEVG